MGEKQVAMPGEASGKARAAAEGEKGREAPGDDHSKAIMQDPAPPVPTKLEIAGWHAYSFCSYFVHTVLLPVLFPLIIAQATDPTSSSSPSPEDGRAYNARGISCLRKEMLLYQSLVTRSMAAHGSRFSPLHWTAMSWAAGTILAKPVLVPSAWSLDNGRSPPTVLATATIVGGLFCLLTGFFKTRWVFPLYVAAITAADAVAGAAHSRHLSLMVRGLTERLPRGRRHFPRRRDVTGGLSLHATAAGCVGAAVIAVFTYHMLRRSDQHTSLWVVSIFSGLLWLAGTAHAFTTDQPGEAPGRRPDHGKLAHVIAIFQYPHAAGSLLGIFLSSFSSMCIFTGGILYVFGELCMKPITLLYLWMTYFIFPVVSLPALHLLQLVLRADAVRMQLLGFFMSAATAGAGFYYRGRHWHRAHVLLVALLQSTAAGSLHAFGRALASDCAPAGREGAFSVWNSWVRTAGSCAGFAAAAAYPCDVGRTFGMSFSAVAVGICVLIFGNISHEGGVKAAGNAEDEGADQESCQVEGTDEMGEAAREETRP